MGEPAAGGDLTQPPLGRIAHGTWGDDEQVVANTLGTVLKYREDHQRVQQHGIAEVVKVAIEKGLLHA